MQPTQASDDTSFAILTSASSAPSRLGPGAANLPSASSAPEKSASTTSTQTTVSVPPSHTVTWNISPQKSPPTSVKQVATTPAIGGNRLSTGPRPMEHIGDKVVPLSSPRQERLRTFEGWRSDRPLKKEDLADAGFFYTGYGDCVRCFYCQGALRSWEPGDNPWTEHARFFPKCRFICTLMGGEFIDIVTRLGSEKIDVQMVLSKMTWNPFENLEERVEAVAKNITVYGQEERYPQPRNVNVARNQRSLANQ